MSLLISRREMRSWVRFGRARLLLILLPVVAMGSAAQVKVSLNPLSACVIVQRTQQFQAIVTGTTNTAVTWQVNNVTGGNSSGGTISQAGLYTAPSSPTTSYVKAISQANTSSVAVAQAIIRSTPGILIAPHSGSVKTNTSMQFTPTLCGLSSGTSLIWSVDGITGGNSNVGTVSSSGLYTAPSASGSHTVRVWSSTDSTKNASAIVSVYSQVTVDFGSRLDMTHPLPAGMVDAQLGLATNGFYTNQPAMKALATAGISELRVDSAMQDIFQTSGSTSGNFSGLDALLGSIQAAGMRPLVIVGYTPAWLQPTPNPCGTFSSPYHAAPTDINEWAQLVKALVAHIDLKYPKFVKDYEIWNEPDNVGLCTSPNTDSQRRSIYLQLYGAAAPLISHQAAADGTSVRIGGPALTNVGNAANWISALVNNSSTAPFVNFVSYHYYVNGLSATQAGMLWDNTVGPESVSFRTQDPSAGMAAAFQQIYSLVKVGLQPNPTSTPIYIDEYNITATYVGDCCRNKAPYAYLWNAMLMQDAVNIGYSGIPVPNKLMYFAAQDWFSGAPGASFFCFIGVIDAAMDCAYSSSNLSSNVPYPQYYAYNLIAGPSYLGMRNGGFLAKSVWPPMKQAGIVVSGFYTTSSPKLDSIVLTNPTKNDYNSLTIVIKNPGAISSTATFYILNSLNPTITKQSLPLTPVSGGFAATISLPHYTVVGIALTAQ